MDSLTPNNSEGEFLIEDKAIFSEFIDKKVHIQTEECLFKGVLKSIDGYLNLVVENVEMFVDVEPKETINFKTCFLRGVTIKHINIARDI